MDVNNRKSDDAGKTSGDDRKIAGDAGKPAGDPPENTSGEHPEFQKRIDQLTARIHDLTRRYEQEQQLRAKDSEAFRVLAEQNKKLSEMVTSIDDKISESEAPDPEESLPQYLQWQEKRLLDKIKKMLENKNQPVSAPVRPPSGAAADDAVADPRELVMQTMYDDYQEVVTETINDMKTDRALYNMIWGSDNPYKEAYNYGVRKLELAGKRKQNMRARAYAEGGSSVSDGSDNDLKKLSDDERFIVQKMRQAGVDMTEEKYIKAKQRLANRRKGL